MYIFGKIDAFCKRIQKVVEMFSIIEKFSKLESLQIEGIDTVVLKRFAGIVTQMQRKPYDILDHRKNEFDGDFASFKKQVHDLEGSLQHFIDSAFDHIGNSTEQSLLLLSKFSQIEGMQLDLESKYHQCFVYYIRRDIDGVRKLYQKHKDAPPHPRLTPPIAGAILWVRQLYRRIEFPMKIFQESTKILEMADAKRHIRNYNKLARTLMEFELLYYRAWVASADQTRSGLQATLLVQDHDGSIYVNLDPRTTQFIKETQWMQKLGLECPDQALELLAYEPMLKNIQAQLTLILETKKHLLSARLPPILLHALSPHLEVLDRALEPGLSTLNWRSLGVNPYLERCHLELANFGELVDKLVDVMECRVEAGIKRISEVIMVELPGDWEQWSVEEFVSKVEVHCADVVAIFNSKTHLVECATRDMITEMMKGVSEGVGRDLMPAYDFVYAHVHQQLFEAMVLSARTTFEHLKVRLGGGGGSSSQGGSGQSGGGGGNSSSQFSTTGHGSMSSSLSFPRPFFKTEMALSIPQVVLVPKLEDVQAGLTRVTSLILEVMKRVDRWPPFHESTPSVPQLTHLEDFNLVGANKDVNRIILGLNTAVASMRKDVEMHRDVMVRFDHVWKEDRNESIQRFLASSPILADFEEEIRRFEAYERDIAQIPSHTTIQMILVSAEPLKMALLAETRAWIVAYGLNLNEKVRGDMEELVELMEVKTARLSRKISDIDDLRMAVQCLAEIRESEVTIDMKLPPIEEAYQLLHKHQVFFPTSNSTIGGLWLRFFVDSFGLHLPFWRWHFALAVDCLFNSFTSGRGHQGGR